MAGAWREELRVLFAHGMPDFELAAVEGPFWESNPSRKKEHLGGGAAAILFIRVPTNHTMNNSIFYIIGVIVVIVVVLKLLGLW